MMTLSFKYYRIWSNDFLYSFSDRENQNWIFLILWFEEIMRAHSNLRISYFWKNQLSLNEYYTRYYKHYDSVNFWILIPIQIESHQKIYIYIVVQNLKITLSNQSIISHEKNIEYIFLTQCKKKDKIFFRNDLMTIH